MTSTPVNAAGIPAVGDEVRDEVGDGEDVPGFVGVGVGETVSGGVCVREYVGVGWSEVGDDVLLAVGDADGLGDPGGGVERPPHATDTDSKTAPATRIRVFVNASHRRADRTVTASTSNRVAEAHGLTSIVGIGACQGRGA